MGEITFPTIESFIAHHEFASADQVLTIPVTEDIFEGIGADLKESDRDKARACIVFVSPVHLYAA
jgi:hypothetical protein